VDAEQEGRRQKHRNQSVFSYLGKNTSVEEQRMVAFGGAGRREKISPSKPGFQIGQIRKKKRASALPKKSNKHSTAERKRKGKKTSVASACGVQFAVSPG